MIIVKVLGGLGNQMFQYACGRALSLEIKQNFVLEKSFFIINKLIKDKNVDLRDFELGVFALEESGPKGVVIISRILHICNRLILFLTKRKLSLIRTIDDGDLSDLNDLVKKSGSVNFLTGYFQRENFFKKYETEIRNDFQFKAPCSKLNQEYIDKMNRENSVSIHVRRGDFIKNEHLELMHGSCSLDYYKKSITLMESKIKSPVFYVFSDDLEWCKDNLTFRDFHFLSHNQGKDSFEDMRLMSQCKHNIIANSSFSWWGAWLNRNPNKIVIAPEKWSNAPSKKGLADKKVPPGWIRI